MELSCWIMAVKDLAFYLGDRWHNFLEFVSYNVVLTIRVYLILRKLMRSRLSDTLISFLIIFVVSLGTSLAGSLVCPPGCPDCAVVPACCAEMDDGAETRGMADHLPGPSGCSHDGICLDGFLPNDVSAASNGTLKYESTLVLSPLSFRVYPDLVSIAVVPVPLESPIEQFPSLYLRICSFLI